MNTKRNPFTLTDRSTLTELILLVAIAAILAAFAIPALAQDQQGYPRRVMVLASGQALTNAQTVTLNVGTNLHTSIYPHQMVLWGSVVCTNPLVAGTVTAKAKFAYDQAATNFVSTTEPVALILPCTGSANSVAATNITAATYDGATGIEVTTLVTTGQTNGANGGYIGQTVNLYLDEVQPR